MKAIVNYKHVIPFLGIRYSVSPRKLRSMTKLRFLMMAVVVAGGLTACGLDVPKEVPSSYETMTVEKKDITMPIKFSAKLKGQSDVTIMPQVSGQLMKISVTEGQQVRKGQVLFVIDSRNAQHELEAANANLQAANANLTAALAQANSAKLEFESNQNLFEKKIVSSYMLENSRNSYNQAQAAVSQAKASVSQAKAAVSRARVNLGFCTITAPVTGVIGSIPVRGGDQVSPMTQLTVLSGNTTMDAEFSVSEAIIEAQVQSGLTQSDKQKHIDMLPDVTFVMKNGTDGHLYSGVQGTVVLPLSQKDVMVIPQTAVVRLQNKSLVYKVKGDSTATAVTVTVQDAGNGKDFIVKSGLNVGEKIVTVGANNVQEGERVLFPEVAKNKK